MKTRICSQPMAVMETPSESFRTDQRVHQVDAKQDRQQRSDSVVEIHRGLRDFESWPLTGAQRWSTDRTYSQATAKKPAVAAISTRSFIPDSDASEMPARRALRFL